MGAVKSNALSREKRELSNSQRKLHAYRGILKQARRGGRCLDAIWERTDLSTGERAVLQQVAALHDYRSKVFTHPVEICLKRLCARTHMSPSGVRKVMKQLEGRGLLVVTKRKDRYGADRPSLFQLTWKLFKDFAQARLHRKLAVVGAMPWDAPAEEAAPTGGQAEGSQETTGELPQHTEPAQPAADSAPADGLHSVDPQDSLAASADAPDSEDSTECGGEGTLSGGEGTLSEALFPSSLPSNVSFLKPPVVPLQGDLGRVPLRYQRANYLHLLNLALTLYAQWQRHCEEPWKWKPSGFESLAALMASRYPQFLLKLMAPLAQKWSQGVGRQARGGPDIYFWAPEIDRQLKRFNAEHELATITDIQILSLSDLVNGATEAACAIH